VIVYRHATFGTPLRTEPARQPGRFHDEAQAEPTQYLCLHPLGPLAELMRGHSLRRPDQIRHVRARTWALRLTHHGALPEIGFDTAQEHGLKARDLVADDHARCRRLAERLRRAGTPGIVVPSAALPGTRNVVLFGPRVGSPYLLEPLGEVDVPASITAHAGRPIASLIERVRYRGDVHAALRAWQRGEPYVFDEPDWSTEAA
jgi:RES domain-containing protein